MQLETSPQDDFDLDEEYLRLKDELAAMRARKPSVDSIARFHQERMSAPEVAPRVANTTLLLSLPADLRAADMNGDGAMSAADYVNSEYHFTSPGLTEPVSISDLRSQFEHIIKSVDSDSLPEGVRRTYQKFVEAFSGSALDMQATFIAYTELQQSVLSLALTDVSEENTLDLTNRSTRYAVKLYRDHLVLALNMKNRKIQQKPYPYETESWDDVAAFITRMISVISVNGAILALSDVLGTAGLLLHGFNSTLSLVDWSRNESERKHQYLQYLCTELFLRIDTGQVKGLKQRFLDTYGVDIPDYELGRVLALASEISPSLKYQSFGKNGPVRIIEPGATPEPIRGAALQPVGHMVEIQDSLGREMRIQPQAYCAILAEAQLIMKDHFPQVVVAGRHSGEWLAQIMSVEEFVATTNKLISVLFPNTKISDVDYEQGAAAAFEQ